MGILTGLMVKIGADNSGLVRGLKDTQAHLSKTGAIVKTLARSFAGFFSIYALGGIVRNAIQTNIQFEKSMANVKAITGATGKEFSDLKNDAKRLGAATEYTASEVAALQVEYGRLGFSTQEILDATAATLDLATATGEELARAAEVAGATVRGFGLDVTETIRVTDVMASSFNKSALNLERFAESMKYVAPVARVAGVTLEETAAMLSVLADAGIHGSLAGTALRQILSEMEKTGKPLSVALADLAAKGLTLADAEDEVGQRAKTALIVLTKNIEKLPELTDVYNNVGGATKNMADIQRDTVQGSLKTLQSAWEGLILSFDNGNSVLQDTVDLLTDVVRVAQWLSGKWDYIKWLPVFLPARGAARAFSDSVEGLSKLGEEAAILGNMPVPNWLQPETFNGVLAPLDDYILGLERLQTAADPSIGLLAELDAEIKKLKDEIDNAPDFTTLVELTRKLYEAEGRAKALKQAVDDALLTERSGSPVSAMTPISGPKNLRWTAGMPPALTAPTPINWDEIKTRNDEVIESMEKVGIESEHMAQMVAGAFTSMAQSLGSAIANMLTGTAKETEILDSLLQSLGQFMSQMGAALISVGFGSIAFKKALANPYTAIAAGAALVALGEVFKGIVNKGPESFAQGGIVTGPTLAMVGDNPSGKEMILPLERAGEIFGGVNTGSQLVVLETRVRGTDLYLINKRITERREKYT